METRHIKAATCAFAVYLTGFLTFYSNRRMDYDSIKIPKQLAFYQVARQQLQTLMETSSVRNEQDDDIANIKIYMPGKESKLPSVQEFIGMHERELIAALPLKEKCPNCFLNQSCYGDNIQYPKGCQGNAPILSNRQQLLKVQRFRVVFDQDT